MSILLTGAVKFEAVAISTTHLKGPVTDEKFGHLKIDRHQRFKEIGINGGFPYANEWILVTPGSPLPWVMR